MNFEEVKRMLALAKAQHPTGFPGVVNHLVRDVSRERRKDAKKCLALLLRQGVDLKPLAQESLAAFLDPGHGGIPRGKKPNKASHTLDDCWQAALVLGEVQAQIGSSGGPSDMINAEEDAAERLGISRRTLQKRVAGSMRKLVTAVRTDKELTEEECRQIVLDWRASQQFKK